MKKKIMPFACYTLIALLTSTSLFAQNSIRGTVTEKETGKPIPYAYVYVKGTNAGSLTSEEGVFAISAPSNAVLVFSSLGYTTQEERVSDRSTINVTLSMESFGIEEVIAVAYTTTRKKDLISSVASVRGEEISKTPVSGFNEAMQGKMAGVQIYSSSGTPGGAITVRIRGAASITAGNDPLYVVDGIPITTTDFSQAGFGGQTNNPLANVNPSDIESLQVLKDAAASSLYGSRASNGVVLITTKKGRASKARVTFDSYYGVQDLWRELSFLGTEQWLEAQNEARTNYNKGLGYSPGGAGYVAPITAEVPWVDTKWLKEVTNASPMIASAQASVSGGNDNTQFFLSSGWFKQEGIQKTNQYERYNFRARVNHRFNQKVRISLNTSFGTSDNNRMFGDNNIFGPIFNAARNRPDQPVYDPKDPTKYYTTTTQNPVACFKETYNLNRSHNLSGNFKFEWNILENLVFSSTLGADYTQIHELVKFYPKSPQAGLYEDAARDYNSYVYNYLIENTLTYSKKVGKSTLSAMAGQSFQQRQNINNYAFGAGFPVESFRWLESAAVPKGVSSQFREFVMESYFGRVSANIDDRYMIEGTIRSDASSKFAKEYRVGVFPAGSVGWRVSKESFFPQNGVLTDVKVRGSVGLTGNQEGITYYRYLSLYNTGTDYDLSSGMFPNTAMSTSDLTWEKTLKSDIGLDLVFLNGRVEFTYDYFLENTYDLLLNRNIPITTGHSQKTENIGKVRNKGHEFSLFSRNVINPKFKWNTSVNITFIDNKVTAIGKNSNGEWEGFATGNFSYIDVGYPLSTFYMIKAIGIYQNDSDVPTSLYKNGVRAGDVIYEDLNGDGQINASDKQKYKQGSPTAYGGLTNTFSYRGFDAELGVTFSVGSWIYTYWKETAGDGGRGTNGIFQPNWVKRWTPENPHNDPKYPRFVYGGTGAGAYNTLSGSSRWLHDASYLRIKSFSLGYTIPEKILHKIKVDRIRLYVQAQNLYTFTKFDGMDPEVEASPTASAERGVDFFTVPPMRSITFGINLTF